MLKLKKIKKTCLFIKILLLNKVFAVAHQLSPKRVKIKVTSDVH